MMSDIKESLKRDTALLMSPSWRQSMISENYYAKLQVEEMLNISGLLVSSVGKESSEV